MAIVPYIGPVLLVALTFLLAPLRQWLERVAHFRATQVELIESYQAHASRFLRETDPERDGGIRGVVHWAGVKMVQGTSLIDRVVYARTAGIGDKKSAKEQFARLSPGAKEALAQALGLALCVSASNSVLRHERYLALLEWLLSKPTNEVKEPEQVVYRYSATEHHNGDTHAHA